MKIAILVDRCYPFFTGGYEMAIYQIFTRLSSKYDITKLTSIKEDYTSNNLKFISISKHLKYVNKNGVHSMIGTFIFFLNTLYNIKKLKKYDTIIINTIPYVGLSYIMKKLKNKKIISIFHEAWYNYPEDYISRFILRNSIRNIVLNSSFVISISNPTTNSLIKNYNVKNVYTIPLGIDLKTINSVEASHIRYDIVYLGRLSSIKRIDDLINAIYIIKNNLHLELNVAIIGNGDLLDNLMSKVNGYNLKKNINFLGKIDENKKYSILKSSKIFVMPSEREGFSIATIEAMACGCVPIIAKPNYDELFGVSHFVHNNENGLYYDVYNYNELVEKIIMLLKDNELYNKLKQNAINDSRNYDWNFISEKYNYILNDL